MFPPLFEYPEKYLCIVTSNQEPPTKFLNTPSIVPCVVFIPKVAAKGGCVGVGAWPGKRGRGRRGNAGGRQKYLLNEIVCAREFLCE